MRIRTTRHSWICSGFLAIALLGCNSGNSDLPTVPSAAWPRFRHDSAHTGQGSGNVAAGRATPLAIPVDAREPLSPVISSPAIGIDGVVYVASRAGTLLSAAASGEVRWRVETCEACPAENPGLGEVLSSPTLFAPPGGPTVVYFGSEQGRLYAVEDRAEGPTCTLCFDPARNGEVAQARFSAPPLLVVHSVTGRPVQVIAPAAVRTAASSDTEQGIVWAVSPTGDVLWRYPQSGSYPAPFVSSPALALGNSVLVASSDGHWHLLAALEGGVLRWRSKVGPGTDPDTPVALAPVVSTTAFYANTSDGTIRALAPDGSGTLWLRVFPEASFAASLALGAQFLPTETPTLTPTPTLSIATATPTPSPVAATTPVPEASPSPTATASPTATPPSLQSVLFGVTKDGRIIAVRGGDGRDAPLGDVQQAVEGAVLSSPALSSDGYLVFGTTAGILYALDNGTGLPAWPPLQLTSAAIRSSAAVDFDGTIWVGADDGYLYRVGTQ